MGVEVISDIGRKWDGKENCEPGAQVLLRVAEWFVHSLD